MAASMVMRCLSTPPRIFRTICTSHSLTVAKSTGPSSSYYHSDQNDNQGTPEESQKYQTAEDETSSAEPHFFTPIHFDKGSHEMLLITKPDQPKNAHMLRVAIIGCPNVGKSTLVNSLLGRRVFSVSKKVHTTRSRATGVLTLGKHQIIFLDTPGIVSPQQGKKYNLPRPLMTDSRNALEEADLVAVMVDVGNKNTRNKLDPDIMMTLHQKQDVPAILVLNKVDLLKNKQELFGIVADLTEGILGGKPFDAGRQGSRQGQWGEGSNSLNAVLSSRKAPQFERDEETRHLSRSDITHDSDFSESDILEAVPSHVQQPSSDGENGSESRAHNEFHDTLSDHDSDDLWYTDGTEGRTGQKLLDHSESSVGEKVTSHFQGSSYDPPNVTGSSSQYSRADMDQSGIGDGRYERTVSDYCDSAVALNGELKVEGDTDTPLEQQLDSKPGETAKQTLHLSDDRKAEVMLGYIRNLNLLEKSGPKSFQSTEDMSGDDSLAKLKQREWRRLRQSFDRRKGWPHFKKVFMVSALNSDGTEDLKDYFVDCAKPGLWEFHSDMVTDLSPDVIILEAIREQLLERLPQEVPYAIRQVNEMLQVGEDGELQIYQKLICERKSHLAMVERKKASIIFGATRDLMNAFHCEVLLRIHAVLRKEDKEKW